MRALVAIELDRPARPHRLEPRADRDGSGDGAELPEQRVPLVPADLNDFSRYVDLHTVESAGFHSRRAYSGVLA
jgi:hypothetical protein